ncbi:tetratricopeptide repeat protein [bacterium]|nr:tetratricopeptide repeat protein [bacterium]
MFYFGFGKVRRFFIFHSMYNKGINRENLGEYPKALNNLFLALSLMPKSFKTYIAIARVNQKNKTFLNAIDFYNKAIMRFPKNAELHALKAYVLRKIKDYDNALISYNKAIQLDGEKVNYYTERGNLKYQMNDLQGAINDYTGALCHNNTDYKLYEQRAFYQFEKKNYESAETDYKAAINICPNNAHLYFMLGMTEKLLNKTTEAETNLKKSQELGLVIN